MMSSKGNRRKAKKKKGHGRIEAPESTPTVGMSATPAFSATFATSTPSNRPDATPSDVPVATSLDILTGEARASGAPHAGDLDAAFFEASWREERTSDLLDLLELDDRRSRRMAPFAVERRAKLAIYVKASVGVAVVVCVAALIKGLVTADEKSADAWSRPQRRFGVSAAAAPEAAQPLPPAVSDLDAGAD
jgi:hypothetical protein